MLGLHTAKDNSLITVPGMNRVKGKNSHTFIFKVKNSHNTLIFALNQYGQSEINYNSTLKRIRLVLENLILSQEVKRACSLHL